MGKSQIEELYREAAGCRVCFDRSAQITRDLVGAQPRPVPDRYWAGPRILTIFLNPGKILGCGPDQAPLVQLYGGFHAGEHGLDAINSWETTYHNQRSRRTKMLFQDIGGADSFGLNPEEVAQLNIALCSALVPGERINAPTGRTEPMRRTCWDRHTQRLAQSLAPRVIIVCSNGQWVRNWLMPRLHQACPEAEIVMARHFAAPAWASVGKAPEQREERRRLRKVIQQAIADASPV